MSYIYFYTPRLWRVGCHSFDIVCLWLCVSVTTLTAERTDVRTWIWHAGQVEGYLGQVHMSRSRGQNNVSWDVPLTSKSRGYGPAKEETQEYDVGCFQSVCVFFGILLDSFEKLVMRERLLCTEATEANFFPQESSSTDRIWVRFYRNWVRTHRIWVCFPRNWVGHTGF